MLLRDSYAVVDLKRLKNNIEKVHARFNRPLMAVIKADAYGHGFKEVALYIHELEYLEMFAVATLEEALELRELNIKKGILVLGAVPTRRAQIELAIENEISLALVSLEYYYLIKSFKLDKPVKVHIKLDTGMGRIGLQNEQQLKELLDDINPGQFEVEGIFTHFATADGDEAEYKKQLEKYYRMTKGLKFKYMHCNNSAGMFYHDERVSNLGRIGITMYGLDPAGEHRGEFEQVMSLYSNVVMVKKIPKGSKVGYGMTYTAKSDEYIATIPLGYADGFIRKNQGREVYIKGKYYQIVGRVCMDQCMIKVDESIKVGDQVEIFGDHISLDSMAKELDTISYEVICLIKRIPIIYKK